MRSKGVNFRIKGHDETNAAFNKLNGNLKRTQQQMRSQVPIQRSWNKGLSANRRAVQQFGFQLSDFAVQIAGGQNAMLAFTQQGGQMLQFFGPAGAVLAAFLAVFGSLGIAIARSGVGLAEITPIMGVLREEFVFLGNTLGVVKELFIDFANLVVNNLDVILITASLVAGFFAARWVSSFVAGSGAVVALRGAILASVISIRTFGVVAGTAQIVTMAFASALGVVRAALLRLGIPALVIGLGYLIERFLALVQGAGGFAQALEVLGRVATQVFQNIDIAGFALWQALKGVALSIAASFVDAFKKIARAWDSMMNAFTGSTLLETLGIDFPILHSDVESKIDDVAGGLNNAAAAAYKLSAASFNSLMDAVPALKEMLDLMEETKVDVRDWFGGAVDGDGGGAGGGGGGISKLKKDTEDLKRAWEGLRDTIANSFRTAFQGLLNGTKSVKDAALEMLGTVLNKVIEIMTQPLFTRWATGIANIIGPALGLPTFDGGGHTGYGPRSGGLDGRGGRLAIVHPNEDIRDNTRPWQRERRGGNGDVHVHQHNNFALGVADTVRAEVMNMMPAMAEVTAQVVREKVERGGDYGATFG